MGLLDGKVAVITGAGRGIGRAEALLFAREGARVVLNDTGCARDGSGAVDPGVARAVAEEVRAAGGEAVESAHEITTAEGAQALVDLAVERFGGLDVLVNNAGIVRDKGFLRMDLEDFAFVLSVQLRGTFLVSQRAARRMVEQKRGGRIVNTAGPAGYLGNLGQANQSAAHGGVLGLTRTMAIELKKHAIAVNALAPIARTRLTEDLPMFQGMPEETYGPQFVAPAALFLSSSLAGDLTGEVLSVAGTRLSVFRAVETPGALADDPRAPWDPREIRARWDALSRGR